MRALKDFVKDMIKKGRSDEHILAVARCSQWGPQMSVIKNNLKKKGRRWRKKFSAEKLKKAKEDKAMNCSIKSKKGTRIVLKRKKS